MHIRHHTGEKTFSCTDCDSSSCELYTPEPICDKSFKYFLLVVPICDKSFKCFLFVLDTNLNIKYLQIVRKLSYLSLYLTRTMIGISTTRHGRHEFNKL